MRAQNSKVMAGRLSLLLAAFLGVGCGTSAMMQSEQAAVAGRAADVASQRASDYEQQRLQLAAVEASQAEVGAERGEADGSEPAESEGNTFYMECGDEGPGFVVVIERERARLFMPNGEVVLPHMPSASGTKYTDGKTILWTEGSAAIFEDADGHRFMCSNNPEVAVWQDARRRGVFLRGIGKDWVVELDPKSTVLVVENGQSRFDIPTPDPDKDGAKTSYFGRDGSTTVRITSERKDCVDAGTGEKFGLSIEVDLGGDTLRGCGRDLSSAER